MVAVHPWKLVGPWYRWNTIPEDPGSMRASRPVIQKYADSNHVQAFLDNPQRSLRYLKEDATRAGKRKVFLDTHDRFYLVSCELHCDMPGFPKVDHDKVCEAGFVVRKRKTDVPDEIRGDVESLLQEMSYERSRLNRIESKTNSAQPKIGIFGVAKALKQAADSARLSTRSKHKLKLADRQARLQDLITTHAISHHVQAWIPQENGLGVWREQEDELTQDIEEHISPLYPLVPDQTDESHTSGHKTLFYGLLPVGSADRDAFGNPQFDDKAVYEIRCFVRRHKPPCPKTNQRSDCKGDIVWSRPTEAYQLAPHFDLIGTSNRVTIIQAPDLVELAEQVNGPDFKMGQGLGLGVATPSNSALPIDVDGDATPLAKESSGLPSICFFSIPLITIVALFLLRLILPVVVFLFGLWFLLRLKLCILPQISVDLSVELDAGLEGELALEADLSLSANFSGLPDKLVNEVLPELEQGMQDWFNDKILDDPEEAYRLLARLAIDQSIDFSDSGIAPGLVEEIKDAIESGAVDEPKNSGSSLLPNPADRLDYYPTKELSEVFI